MADISLDFQNIVIEYCIPVSFNVIKKIMQYFVRYVRFCFVLYVAFIIYILFVVYFLFFKGVICALCTVCVYHIPFYTKYCCNFFLGMIKT